MQFSYTHLIDDIYLVKLDQPLNAETADALIAFFKSLLAEGITRIVVDLSAVPLIDSKGLGALMMGHRLFGNVADNFRLVGPQSQPKLLFELTMFDKVFQIHDSVEALLKTEPTP